MITKDLLGWTPLSLPDQEGGGGEREEKYISLQREIGKKKVTLLTYHWKLVEVLQLLF